MIGIFACGYFAGFLTLLIGAIGGVAIIDFKQKQARKREERFLKSLTQSILLVNRKFK